MKLSLVIPAYTLNKDLEQLTLFCAESYKPFIDELIISEDGGMYSEEMRNLADVYIYNKTNQGFTKNVNTGWKVARGDYVCIANSDTRMYEGDLRNLCIPGIVTSPHIVNQGIPRLAGSFWCSPKSVTDKRGYLVETMRTYYSDTEYDERVQDIFLKVPEVQIYHEIMRTVIPAGVEGGAEHQKDRESYLLWKKSQLAS